MNDVMLATSYDPDRDYTGWWMSEKLDGVRAIWDGKNLRSRSGNVFNTPAWFTHILHPHARLDGELWMGYNQFPQTLSAVKRRRCRPHDWTNVTYQVFDAPAVDAPFERRYINAIDMVNYAKTGWREHNIEGAMPYVCPIRLVMQEQCKSKEHLEEYHEKVIAAGGEGVMLRAPGSLYERRRNSNMLKVKVFHDAEAEVVGYKHSDRREYAALRCRLVSDPSIEFDVGSGITDDLLKDPPKVGTIITFQYQAMNSSGKPRHPSFLRLRNET